MHRFKENGEIKPMSARFDVLKAAFMKK